MLLQVVGDTNTMSLLGVIQTLWVASGAGGALKHYEMLQMLGVVIQTL